MMVGGGAGVLGAGETGGLAGGAVGAPVPGLPAAAGGVAGGWLDGGTALVAGVVTGVCEPALPFGAETAPAPEKRVGR